MLSTNTGLSTLYAVLTLRLSAKKANINKQEPETFWALCRNSGVKMHQMSNTPPVYGGRSFYCLSLLLLNCRLPPAALCPELQHSRQLLRAVQPACL